jgi:hypothetical protein
MEMNSKFYKNTFKLILFTLVILITSNAFSQNTLQVKGRLDLKEGKTKEGSIKLYENGNLVQSQNADRTGKFSFDLALNKDYIFEFSSDGYVTKKININTEVPSNAENKSFTPIYFAVELFHQYTGVNTIVFTQPVGIIKYYPQIGDFDYDVDYSTEIRNQVDKAEKELEKAHQDHLQEQKAQELAKQQQAQAAAKAAEELAYQQKIEAEKQAAIARKAAEEEAKRLEAEKRAALLAQQKELAKKRAAEEAARKEAERLEKERIAEEQRKAAEEKAKLQAEEEARKKQLLKQN